MPNSKNTDNQGLEQITLFQQQLGLGLSSDSAADPTAEASAKPDVSELSVAEIIAAP